MATQTINAEKEDIAPVVIMPGDPVRAKYIADNFLHGVKTVGGQRGIYLYTGYSPNHKRITIMASGMGMPSMGIYSYELFKEMGVQLIIRIGTCGVYQPKIKIKDLIIASTASTDSSWGEQYGLGGHYSAGCDFYAANAAYLEAKKLGITTHVGNILSSDVFYDDDPMKWKKWAKLGVLGVEMESYALYCNAARLNKRALAIFTATDHFVTHDRLPAEERVCLDDMAKVAIGAAEKLY